MRWLGLAALGLAGLAQAVTCQNGIPAGNPDSVYVADPAQGTVTDSRTGLMWKTCVEGQTWDGATCVGNEGAYTWSEALALAETAAFAGHDDWRLPNVNELSSLTEPCRISPSINNTLFPNTPSSDVWSGSPYAGYSNGTWIVAFGYGNAYYYNRGSSNGVRLVRARQSFDTFALTVTKGGTGGGTVTSTPAGINCGTTCAANFPAGTASVTLAASAADGSTFTGWSANCAPLAADPRQCTVTVTTPQTVTATFSAAPVSYSLSVSKVGNGTVTSSPAGITCGTGSGCAASFASGTGVTLTATADSGYTFTGWGGACSGTGACAVSMTAARNVTATFVAMGTQTIGLIALGSSGLIVGGSATLSATATSGLAVTFGSQTPTICTVSGNTVTARAVGTCLVTANQAGNASFQPAPQVTLAIPVIEQPRVGGTITLDLTPYACATQRSVTSLTPAVCQVTSVAGDRALIALNTAGTCQIDVACGTDHVRPPLPPIDKGTPPPIPDVGGGNVGDPIRIPPPPGACSTALTLTSLTPTICHVSGDTVTLDAVGTCRVAVDRAATADCQAAHDELVIEARDPGTPPTAHYQWTRNLLSGWDNGAGDVVFDSATNNVVTVGWFTQSINFHPDNGSDPRQSTSYRDAYVWKMDGNHSYASGGWSQTLGFGVNEGFSSARIDAAGNIYAVGGLDGSPWTRTQSAIRKYAANGQLQWSYLLGGTGMNQANAVALGADGALYIAGGFQGTVNFDAAGNAAHVRTARGGWDGYLLKLSAAGQFVWVQTLGGTGDDFLSAVDVRGSAV